VAPLAVSVVTSAQRALAVAAFPTAAEDMSVELRDIRYAKTPDGVYIAYQAFGEKPIDLVWQFDFFSDLDVMWESPRWDTFLRSRF
jgi:hypothetical protein